MSIDYLIVTALYYVGLSLIHGTALAVITWVLSVTILRRSRPAIHAFLWTVVLIKFFVPPVFPGEMALSGWISNTATRIVIRQNVNLEPPNVSIIERRPDIDRPKTAPVLIAPWLMQSLVFCYLFLVSILAARTLRTFTRAKRTLRSLPPAPSNVISEVRDLAGRLGIRRAPDVRIIHSDTTPYVSGLIRPVLVLPQSLLQMRLPFERQSLLLHELAHLRRKDVAIRYLQSLAAILFFFYPPILWISRRIEHFSEMACDHWAVAISDIDPADYAGALVKVIREMSPALRPQTGLALVGRVGLLEKRMRAVFDNSVKGPPQASLFLKLLLASWCLFVFLGGSTARVSKPAVAASLITTDETLSETVGQQTETQSATTRTRQRKAIEAKAISAESSREGVTSGTATGFSGNEVVQTRIKKPETAGEPGLSNFEIGYLLGQNYARERASRSAGQTELTDPPQTDPDLRDRESKRAIELRMQALTKQLPRQ
jgi:beta-lactamase regulating signal transducer with metallopeptidase domain